jgi:hypothetical protein
MLYSYVLYIVNLLLLSLNGCSYVDVYACLPEDTVEIKSHASV